MMKILTIGRLEHRKGHDRLIRSMQYLGSNVKLKIVGRDQDSYSKVLKKLRHDLKLEDRVELVGERPHREVPGLLRSSDVFALASREEGLGLVVLEAMREGKVVVVSDIAAFREIVVHDDDGIVVSPPTPAQFAKWFAWLEENPQFREWYGARGQLTVRRCFSEDSMIQRLKLVYEEVGGMKYTTLERLVIGAIILGFLAYFAILLGPFFGLLP